MNLTIKQEKISAFFLKAMILAALFFPIKDYYPKRSIYYTTFSLITFLALVFIIYLGTTAQTKKVNGKFVPIYLTVILGFALSDIAVNFIWHHYYWEMFHQLTGFVLFLFLIIKLDDDYIEKHRIVEFLLSAAIFSTLIGIITYYGGVGMVVYKAGEIIPQIILHGETTYIYEKRLTFIYPHKSESGLFFLLFLGICLKFKSKFKKYYLWLASIAIFIWAIILTDSVAAIVCGLLIFTGYFFNLIPWNVLWKSYKKWCIICSFFCGASGIIVGLKVLSYIGEKRDIASMGSRFPIWKAAIKLIFENPQGIGRKFEKIMIWRNANNCHNIFLIECLRYSIVVGFLFLLALLIIMYFTLWKNKLFSLACWGSILLVLNIDYSLKEYNFSFFMLCIFILFWHRHLIISKKDIKNNNDMAET